MRQAFIASIVLFLATGCAKQEYGRCTPPDDHLRVMYKARSGLNPFSHSFCIVCHPGLSPEAYAAWATEMGAMNPPDDTDGLLPCLYVYDPARSEAGIDSLNMCVSLACDGGGRFNDMVSESNGNFDLSSILD